MIKLLIFILFIYLVWQLFKIGARFALMRWVHTLNEKTTPKVKQSENLVQCQQCKTFIPESQAIHKKEKYFCSQHA